MMMMMIFGWNWPWNQSNPTIISSDNGLLPGWCQVNIWTNAGILLIRPIGTNFSEILTKIHAFSFKKITLENVVRKIAAILSQPQCFDAMRPEPWFNIKMSSYQYRKSHCGDKTILWPSYLHNGIFYTSKMSSLYWIRALVTSHSLNQWPSSLMPWQH